MLLERLTEILLERMGAAREVEEAAFLCNSSSHGRSDGAILSAVTTRVSQAQVVDQQAQHVMQTKQFLQGVHSSRVDELAASLSVDPLSPMKGWILLSPSAAAAAAAAGATVAAAAAAAAAAATTAAAAAAAAAQVAAQVAASPLYHSRTNLKRPGAYTKTYWAQFVAIFQ